MSVLASSEVAAAGGVLAQAVQSSDLTGVLNEVVALLPIVIPVSVGFIGLRKGIKFLLNTLRSA